MCHTGSNLKSYTTAWGRDAVAMVNVQFMYDNSSIVINTIIDSQVIQCAILMHIHYQTNNACCRCLKCNSKDLSSLCRTLLYPV